MDSVFTVTIIQRLLWVPGGVEYCLESGDKKVVWVQLPKNNKTLKLRDLNIEHRDRIIGIELTEEGRIDYKASEPRKVLL